MNPITLFVRVLSDTDPLLLLFFWWVLMYVCSYLWCPSLYCLIPDKPFRGYTGKLILRKHFDIFLVLINWWKSSPPHFPVNVCNFSVKSFGFHLTRGYSKSVVKKKLYTNVIVFYSISNTTNFLFLVRFSLVLRPILSQTKVADCMGIVFFSTLLLHVVARVT